MDLKATIKKTAIHFWKEWMKPLAIVAAFVLPFKSAIADWNWVPTGSMKPTIMEGDLVYVNKLAFDLKVPFTLWRIARWSQPKRNDIVVFFSPKDGTRLVKRVVGEPGDTIQLKNNRLLLNGKPLQYQPVKSNPFKDEVYEDPDAILAYESLGERPHYVMAFPNAGAKRNFPPVKLPPGKYFMMGDSRDNSADSRYFGLVDIDKIIGKSGYVVFSFDKNHSYKPRWGRTFSEL